MYIYIYIYIYTHTHIIRPQDFPGGWGVSPLPPPASAPGFLRVAASRRGQDKCFF